MHLNLKKSRLTHWWVAEFDDKMNFCNIFSEETRTKGSLKVIGYLDNTEKIAQSTNYVVMITKDGVITAQGSFYPWEEAHELYLRFLIKANQIDTAIARRWKILDAEKCLVLADITRGGVVEENVKFDFIPDKGINVIFSGTSSKLDSKVVFATFSRRDVGCLVIAGVDERVKEDVKKSSYASKESSQKRVESVKKILNEITKGEEILVKN